LTRGRKPIPTALKLARGNPGKRPINKDLPKPKVGAPSCPTWLRREAKAEWKRVAPLLAELGLLSKLDRAVLSVYCDAWADVYECEKTLRKEGRTFTTEKGYIGQHPMVAMKGKARDQIRAFGSLLGLSPCDRGRLDVRPVEPPSLERAAAEEMLGPCALGAGSD
jgi:P27 family predicted phage terminase small subunit